MSMRTPLGRVRGLGSAKTGTHHFWHQRLTGLASLFLSLFAIGLGVALAGADYATAASTMAHPVVAMGMILFVIVNVYHMQIGMQVIIEDYVHGGAKVAMLILNIFFCVAVGTAGVLALLKLSFGA